ncbi:uncharacterized protein LOC113280117 [Papaver somniferum]|uniref:uncharacterized protein LOC113280117 n=1 Tax=Papaver somniferum TaxID=3469 RepID=UPI000E6FA51E|nr:uncharacterized protein LOC113280117 [Papaver somniferum]
MDFEEDETIDKSWLELPRNHLDYEAGVKNFMKFACRDLELGEEIWCPCRKCNNKNLLKPSKVEAHIMWKGFLQGYVHWIYHGEGEEEDYMSTGTVIWDEDDRMKELINEMVPDYDEDAPKDEASNFYQVLEDAKVPLYPGCEKYSRLSFTIHLLHIKCQGGLSIKWFNVLLNLLIKAFPDAKLPRNFYEARKTISNLGHRYTKIDACPNDCMLYWKDDADRNDCRVCGVSRWKTVSSNTNNGSENRRTPKGKKIPEKKLRYFNLKPRLQKLFMSPQPATDMRYHAEERINDGLLRHPADAKTWKNFDKRHPTFAADPRNVRLALASDGMNPYGNMMNPHSTWPVVLIIYNLPPWEVMQEQNFILSMIISGPKSPGNDIDVYLQPLIEELKELWYVGVTTYDASKKEYFQLRAALLGTINDFPALAMLSGWSTKGSLACPCCGSDPCSTRLRYGGKFCYMQHRRFLPADHKWRQQTTPFNGEKELREKPHLMNGDEINHQLAHFEQVEFGKNAKQNGLTPTVPVDFDHNWKKKSVFFGKSCHM